MKKYVLSYKDFLNEANRGNYYPNTKDQFYDFINKYKGQEDLIFISFKSSDKFVSKTNAYYFGPTPQGIYTYPYKNYADSNLRKDLDVLKFGGLPMIPSERFLYVYKLKSLDGFLTFQNKEDYPKALEILEKIKKDYNIINVEEYIEDFLDDNDVTNEVDNENPICLLYTLIFCIICESNSIKARSLFLKYDIKGFVDNGGGFISYDIESQAVIFDIKSIDDYKIIDKRKDIKYKFKILTDIQKRIIDNPKTEIQFKECFDFYGLKFENANFEDGKFIRYNGDINLSFYELEELPKWLENLRYVDGELNFEDCKNLQSVKILSKLEFVESNFNLSGCIRLESLEGLENLRNVGGSFQVNSYKIYDLKGLENLENVLMFNIGWSRNIKTLKGIENIKNVKIMKFTRCRNLTDISSLKNITQVDELWFDGCVNLKDLSPLKNLKIVKLMNFNGCEKIKSLESLRKDLTVSKIVPKELFNQYKNS